MSFVLGYLLGGLPTADWLAAGRGIDLRTAGSGNPGANNARRLGGRGLAVAVLATEVAKGAVAVLAPGGAGDSAAAGVGAVTCKVLSPCRRWRGGQGLGITAGVLVAAAPDLLAVAIGVVTVVAALTRASPPAALAGVTALVTFAAMPSEPWWGIQSAGARVGLALGIGVAIAPKQIARLTPPGRRRRRRSGSPARR